MFAYTKQYTHYQLEKFLSKLTIFETAKLFAINSFLDYQNDREIKSVHIINSQTSKMIKVVILYV